MSELDQEHLFGQARRTRRSIMAMAARNVAAMGVIAGSAVLARTRSAAADEPEEDEPEDEPSCFLRGTNIRTISGERKVEDLAVGDLLPTVFGGIRPIQWMASLRYKRRIANKPWVKDVRPVRITRSALGPGRPHTDLFVTPVHAIYIDGALVRVGSLINGSTIARYAAEEFDVLEYFHIKLESHDVIHAEGAPCETLLTVDENVGDFADYFRTYGASRGEDVPCVPVLSYGGSGRKEMKSRLRSAMSPWFDRRQQIDVIRDRLEERARALSLGRRPKIATAALLTGREW